MTKRISILARAHFPLPCLWLLVACMAFGGWVPANAASDPADWPNWRGPGQDRKSPAANLPVKWNPRGGAGSNVLWANEEAAGISSPIVMNGRLYTLVRTDHDTILDAEKVLCLDATTGEKLWENRFNAYLTDVPPERVGWSSCVGDPETGRIYALGVCGYFSCIDGETGETIWSRSLFEEFGLLSTYGGRTNFPVIFEDLVIISAVMINWGENARPNHTFLAMDKATGETMWFQGTRPLPDDTTYSTPTLTVIDGQQAMVFGAGDGQVWAFQPRTGVPLWNYQLSERGLWVSPLVVNNNVYMAHSEENIDTTAMGAIVAIDGTLSGDITATGAKWKALEMQVGRGAPLLIDGRIYAADISGSLHVHDAETGEPVCRPIRLVGTATFSAPLYVDGKLYICTTSGWNVLEPTPDGAKLIQRMRFPRQDTPVMASPIAAHGRLYVSTAAALYCIAEEGQVPVSSVETPSEKPAEEPIGDNRQVAHLQVIPAESIMRPGTQQKYRVKTFNDRGQLLGESEAEFSVEGVGQVSTDGSYSVPGDSGHAAATVQATVDGVTGTARVRIFPPLPWKFDFNDISLGGPRNQGEPPVTWIGMRYRHAIRDVDGERVMVKVTTIPKGSRSQGVIGPPDMHDYTIQADVRGAGSGDQIPDIGLIAQRYIVEMRGAHQELQIRTWNSRLRMAKTISFSWEPNVWYTMKFSASALGDRAVLRTKIWKRDEAEPDEWTLVAEDPSPNLVGSPGFFGNATTAEVYYDNVIVTTNDS